MRRGGPEPPFFFWDRLPHGSDMVTRLNLEHSDSLQPRL